MVKVAVPIEKGRLAPHFGAADHFAIFEVDDEGPRIMAQVTLTPPTHEKGAYPRFLRDQGVQVVLAGAMGARAVQMLESLGIEVRTGVPGEAPETLVQLHLKGELVASDESCGGGGHSDCGHGAQ